MFQTPAIVLKDDFLKTFVPNRVHMNNLVSEAWSTNFLKDLTIQ